MPTKYSPLAAYIRQTLRKDPGKWANAAGFALRPYQLAPAMAIKDSILRGLGLTFVVVMPRQSGKNETQRHLFGWLMFRAAHRGGNIVSVSPTFKPQTINAMERMRLILDQSILTRGKWRSSAGFIFRYKNSRLQFFSGEPSAKVVGATADLLLSVDEAQDVDPAKFAKDFDPMTASTNATRVFWGTVWTSDTLLARQMEQAKIEQKADGVRRLFLYTADDVRKLVPAYGKHVDRVVAERGRQHPLVKTQYFCEAIDAQTGMFNDARLALMQADQPPQLSPTWGGAGGGSVYAFCIDVAGTDEAMLNLDGLGNPGRDSTTLSIVSIDLTSLPLLNAPTYRIVRRFSWTGASQVDAFAKVKALAGTWRPQHIIIDATGVGEGMWTMLDRAFPERVLPIKFTQQSKSEIGYAYIAVIETGRLRDCAPSDLVLQQYKACQSEILPGPAHTMRWGVPDGKRDRSGQLIHDDHVTADALLSQLDTLDWYVHSPAGIVRAADPLEDMSRTR